MKALVSFVARALCVALGICCVMINSAQAQPAACHALAASPTDPDRKGAGVSYAKMGKDFGNQFMGLEVTASAINQTMESQCAVMGVTVVNPEQVNVVLKCGRNTPILSLAKANLAKNTLRFDTADAKSANVSVRCSN